MSKDRLIVRTKLYRPPLPPAMVRRERLLRILEEGSSRRLTLISAPAGFGKSTLVSQWLEEECSGPSAWLSLDQEDLDLWSVLAYVVAAVRTIFPDACTELANMLKVDELPGIEVLAGHLINGLDSIEQGFCLVVDDFHHVREPRIHELVNRLLQHPPRSLQLVLIARRDPPLRVAHLRAQGQVTEIRLRDLQFTVSETAEILSASWGRVADPYMVQFLHEKTEGWAVGIKLLALSLVREQDLEDLARRLDGPTGEIQDYLVAEVLAGLSPEYRDLLLLSSILDRFSARSCSALLAEEPGKAESVEGEGFLEWLQEADVFCIALDANREWFRFHHLFREILQRHLARERTSEQIKSLHGRAGRFFEELGSIEESMNHALLGPGPREAADLLVRHRDEIQAQELWLELDRWIRKLPREQVEGSPELLMLQAWSAENRYRYEEMFEALDRVEKELCSMDPDAAKTRSLRGEWSAVSSYRSYIRADSDLAVYQAEQALELLPETSLSQRGFAMVILGGALQMAGRVDRAHVVLEAAMRDVSEDADTFQARVLTALCFVQWMDADSLALEKTAARALELGRRSDLGETVVLASYFLGAAHYSMNQLEEAEKVLSPIAAIEASPQVLGASDASFALALVREQQGRHEEAHALAERTTRSLEERNNRDLLPNSRAFEAELALRQGSLDQAMAWAREYDPDPILPTYRFRSPALTQAKVFLQHGSEESFDQAETLLERLGDFYRRIHNRRFLIETLAVHALLRSAQGNEPGALDLLRMAIQETRSRPMPRVFLDLGPKLRDLLNRLPLEERKERKVQRILDPFPMDETRNASVSISASPTSLLEPLTPRQQEILELLEKRLSNKEIGAQLHISSGTVKRHCEDLYGKLGIRGRREVVARARELSLL